MGKGVLGYFKLFYDAILIHEKKLQAAQQVMELQQEPGQGTPGAFFSQAVVTKSL